MICGSSTLFSQKPTVNFEENEEVQVIGSWKVLIKGRGGEGRGGRGKLAGLRHIIRKLKQQRRRRLQKRHLKGEFAPLQTLSRSFHLVYFVKCWQMFLELNSKGLYQSSGKEKKVFVLCSRPRQNVNSGTFTL